MDCVGTHYYRDVAYGGKTPEQIAIEQLQKEVEELQTDVTDLNSFKDKFIIVYPTDTDAVVQQKINTPNINKIIFATGTYNNITTTKTIPSNKTLIGYGATINMPATLDRLILFMNDSNGTIGGWNANENITLLGFTFNCENAQAGSSSEALGFLHSRHIIIKDCTFHSLLNTGGHFIELCGCYGCVIDSCYFYDYPAGSEMVQLDIASDAGAFPPIGGPWDNTASAAIVITNNQFENPQSYTAERGADTFPAAIGNHNKQGNIIAHCKIIGNTFANITTAIRSVSISATVISDNTSYGVFNFFSLGTDSNAATTTKYSGNVITNNSINCATKVDTVTVTDSYKCTAITYNGVNTVIANNQIWNASADGIIMRGHDNVISNNRINNCGRSAISLVDANGISVIGNHCTFNVEKNVDTSDADIRASGQHDCIISDNTVNKMFIYTDKAGNPIINNLITQTLTNTGGTAHNNMIYGAWTE